MRGPIGYLINEALVINDQTHLYIKVFLDGRFKKKMKRSRCSISKITKKGLRFCDEVPFFPEALGFNLPSAELGKLFTRRATFEKILKSRVALIGRAKKDLHLFRCPVFH